MMQTFEERARNHVAAVRRRVMHPANAVGVKPRAVVRPTTRVPAEAFLLARCQELGTTLEAVADRRGPQSMVPIRVALVLEVHHKYPAITKEALGRLFNRPPRRISDILEMYAGPDRRGRADKQNPAALAGAHRVFDEQGNCFDTAESTKGGEAWQAELTN